ncbi:L-ascorbate metabolism protein UlaG, beta-lactamase superfamily [Pontibacter akesuensis]|uniref:L-ascorbate metabolism protein UlaG, beta-lactamase superfamily n=2 Tax=Pontibacter akesuensis TaxID=388950 RepID=A0A1I7GKY8_9BACT|nr:MBL fold metallo-hydrolase [Pontibacter akesuensis]SFU49162.1 L-ascorbate metabolism protein UlaG, beta-lactamase superfamily [Pontibacter akesuensis]
MLTVFLIATVLSVSGFMFMQQGTFGSAPNGKRLERIQNSPNFRNGSFQNLTETPMQAEDASMVGMLFSFFNKPKNTSPSTPIPFVTSDLKAAGTESPSIYWFGHSSYLIKTKAYNVLVDPVFSGYASPVSFMVKAFEGANTYAASDMPQIDVLVLTHDHYDHLDYNTISALKDSVAHFVVPLGVGAHLEDWGVAESKITELDWWETANYKELTFTATPARHFSGRGLARGKSLWTSYVLQMPKHKIYIGGDSGYEEHFKEIGSKFGSFDLAILENGQYNKNWPYIHMMPEQVVQAAKDLQAEVLFPVHSGKFALALHAWNEPLQRVVKSASESQLKVTTPMIGEPIVIGERYPATQWWTN